MDKILIAALAVAAAAGTSVLIAAPKPGTQAARTPEASGADAAHPVVLELYQSQGCSSCPPANAVLDEIANRPDVLALNFAVTYWDRLGWKDSFAQQAFTDRQWEYSRAGGRPNVQTPQLIVNGRAAVLGSYKHEVEKAIAVNSRGKSGPSIAAANGRISIGAGTTAKAATVWLVTYDPRTVQVPIRAGENGGRTLPHRNIVKRLTPLGSWTGPATSFAQHAAPAGAARAVLVQAGKGGPIVAAAKI